MKRAQHHIPPSFAGRIALLLALLASALPAASRKGDEEAWKVREALLSRLSGEWYNIGRLAGECAGIADMLQDIRATELYPPEVTRLTDDELVEFDKALERGEKRQRTVLERVDALRPALTDDIEILRELVIGDPVKEMFQVIETGNIGRLSEMVRIKQQLDSAWLEAGKLLNFAAARMDISLRPDTVQAGGGFEAEFFQIIRANAGLTAQPYYEKLGVIRDSLIARASDTQTDEMYVVDMRRARAYLAQKPSEAALQKVLDIRKRYGGRRYGDDISALVSEALFRLGRYQQALRELGQSPTTAPGLRLRAQCWHQLSLHRELWQWARSFNFASVASGSDRNMMLWLALESALAIDSAGGAAQLAAQADQSAPYLGHVMHALARTFAAKGDWATCISVLERAAQVKTATPLDETIARRINLMIAQAYCEVDGYDKALRLFFTLLNNEQDFEEALYGIIWCYISMGKFDEAEVTLRKLVNQSPYSARAAEAVLIMARRYLSKAQYEWKRATFLAREERRLSGFLDNIQVRAAAADSSGRLASEKAVRDLGALLERVRAEKRAGYPELSAYYDRVNDICAFVQKYYETGSYQEVAFTQRREAVLHRLDSLMLEVRGEGATLAQRSLAQAALRKNVGSVKEVVRQSRLLGAESQIDRYRFECEYIDWGKELNKVARAAATQALRRGDTARADSSAARQARAELARLSSQMDSLVRAEDRQKRSWRQRLIAECTVLLASRLDPENEAYFRYHLGELYYEQDNEAYAQAFARYEQQMDDYEKQLQAYRDGAQVAAPQEPGRPRLDHGRSVECFRRAIALAASPELKPSALYSLAWCFNDAGQIDSAVAQMKALAAGHPQSPYAPQAWMYIGECAFDKSDLQKASDAYQMVMHYPESQWFDEALYKYAWTQYRLSNPEKAISSFLALVDMGSKELSGKSLLEKESMDYIAISFSETDATGEKGLARASRFVDKFGDADKGVQILHRLATVYRDQGRTDMAERTYQSLLKKFPLHATAPVAAHELLVLRERRDGSARVLPEKEAFFRTYAPDGAWARAQTDPALKARGDSLAEAVCYDASISQHQLALQGNDTTAYSAAARLYSQFIRAYPKSPHANECHYNFAEIMFSMGNYYRAAQEYMTVSKRYPDSKYRETAAWNAIVACQNLLKKEEKKKQ